MAVREGAAARRRGFRVELPVPEPRPLSPAASFGGGGVGGGAFGWLSALAAGCGLAAVPGCALVSVAGLGGGGGPPLAATFGMGWAAVAVADDTPCGPAIARGGDEGAAGAAADVAFAASVGGEVDGPEDGALAGADVADTTFGRGGGAARGAVGPAVPVISARSGGGCSAAADGSSLSGLLLIRLSHCSYSCPSAAVPLQSEIYPNF